MTNAKSKTEISMKDILTLPHDAVFHHLRKLDQLDANSKTKLHRCTTLFSDTTGAG
jgi:hypothetical protein